MRTLILEVENELGNNHQSNRFSDALESRYQTDIHQARRRHLLLCMTLGALSYNSFLIWKFFLQRDDFLSAAVQMIGTSSICSALAWVMMRSLPIHLRESIALLPSYAGLAVVYNVIVAGLQTRAVDQTLFIFCLPLMLIYVNTCMKSPFKLALVYNLFALLLIGAAIYQASVSLSIAGLMLTAAGSSAFFTLLGNYWTNVEVRSSYLYRLREELRAASLSRANNNLQRLSETDDLTGLANRRQIQPYLDQLWSSHLHGEAEGAVVLIDIDHFKRYNDHYGHLAGDECLRLVAATLKNAVRPQDAIARFGGEEFVVLLADIRPTAAGEIAHRLLQNVRDLAMPHAGRDDGTAVLTVSVGWAHSTMTGVADGGALFEQADRALYRAKHNGRNRMEGADCAPASGDRVLPTLADLRLAIAKSQLELHFQPLYQISPHQLIGYECLLRWNHAELGPVPPDYFIAMAERSGLIIDLGNWVLENACAMACDWPDTLSLSVNLSPLQLKRTDFPTKVADALARAGLAADRLTLELTEGAELQIDGQVQDNIQQLSVMGVRLALDDFGSGHANLGYLLRLPFKTLKIDRLALRIADDVKRRQVMAALLALGRAFSLEVLAEGVESPEDLALLSELGFDQAQGYLLGRPQAIVGSDPLLFTGQINKM